MKKRKKSLAAGLAVTCIGLVALLVILFLLLRSRGCFRKDEAVDADMTEEPAATAVPPEATPVPEPEPEPEPTPEPTPELTEEPEPTPEPTPAGTAEGVRPELVKYEGREGFMTGDDWLFYTEENGELTLAGGKHKTKWVCMVPKKLARKTVTVIGPDCIAGASGSVILLPETVRTIESHAFSGTGFAVYIPPAATEIAEDAFEGCGSFRIFCKTGSEAERYAKDHGISILTDPEAIEASYTVPDDETPRPYFLARIAYENKEYETVVKLLQPAASEKNPHAAYLLAECYASGFGTDRNSDEAYRLFRIGADAGLGRAEGNVGRCFVQGSGTAKDAAEGVRWLKLAADKNNSLSYLWLGYCYHKGEGVAKDYDKAEELYQRALDGGEAYARNRLNELASDRKKH